MAESRRATAPVLAETIRACRGAFVALAAFSAFVNLLMLTAPLYMLQVFDRVLASRSADTLVALTLMAVGALATLGLLEGLRSLALVKLSGWLDERLGRVAFEASIGGAISSAGAPSVQSLRDLATFRSFVGGPSMLPILDAPWTPVFIAVIFLLSAPLGWMAVGGALALLALALANELSTREPLRRSGAVQILALNQAESALRNVDAIGAMGMLDNLARRWAHRHAEAVAAQAVAGARSGAIGAVSRFVRLTLQIGMLGAGAWLVIGNQLTAGGMLAATILLGRALAPVDQAIGSWKALVAAREAYRRLHERLARHSPATETISLPRPRGEVRCEGVAYGHPGSDRLALKDIGFEVAAGKALGIIGPTASGKTTLARLLVGNLRPSLGQVRLDGMDVSRWPSSDRGRHVGYLPQDIELFTGTVRENIARMGEAEAEPVIAAAQLAGAHEMILRLPDGYETPVGESGAALSGGQRQRIALARALYGNPSLVVLDEPNSNLDQAGLEALLSALGALRRQGTTLVVIAHQPSVVQQVDYLAVLGEGTVQLSGPREEVIAHVTGPAAEVPGMRERGDGHG